MSLPVQHQRRLAGLAVAAFAVFASFILAGRPAHAIFGAGLGESIGAAVDNQREDNSEREPPQGSPFNPPDWPNAPGTGDDESDDDSDTSGGYNGSQAPARGNNDCATC